MKKKTTSRLNMPLHRTWRSTEYRDTMVTPRQHDHERAAMISAHREFQENSLVMNVLGCTTQREFKRFVRSAVKRIGLYSRTRNVVFVNISLAFPTLNRFNYIGYLDKKNRNVHFYRDYIPAMRHTHDSITSVTYYTSSRTAVYIKASHSAGLTGQPVNCARHTTPSATLKASLSTVVIEALRQIAASETMLVQSATTSISKLSPRYN